MTIEEIKQGIESQGFKFDRNEKHKLVFKRNDDEILFCAPCRWIKKNNKLIRFSELDAVTIKML